MKKRTITKAVTAPATERYPKLNATLIKIETLTHQLELSEGRYAHLKYLKAVYDYYLKSKERKTRRRDRIRICKLRGLTVREDADLFSALLGGTSDVTKSARGKYAAKLRDADKKGVASADFCAFAKLGRRKAAPKQVARQIQPKLRLVHSRFR